MKKRKSISFCNLLFVAVTTTFFSCEHKQDPVKIADEHNDAKFHEPVEEDHSSFIVDAAELLLEDIELAKLAQNNSIKKDVRKAGREQELAYTQCYSLLKQIAFKKTISVPTEVSSSDKKTNTDLSYEISDKFDERYFDLAKKDHQEAIDLMETIKSKCNHPEIKAWAVHTLSVYKKNQEELIALQQRLQITNPNP